MMWHSLPLRQFIVDMIAVLSTRRVSLPMILVITYHAAWARCGTYWCGVGLNTSL